MDKIRIFDVPWHIGHQYEQLKFPWADWSWLINYKRNYSESPRGDLIKRVDGIVPTNSPDSVPVWQSDILNRTRKIRPDRGFNWVVDYEPGKYDLAILHLDQQCVEDGILEYGKGSVYRHLNSVIKDIPKIVS